MRLFFLFPEIDAPNRRVVFGQAIFWVAPDYALAASPGLKVNRKRIKLSTPK